MLFYEQHENNFTVKQELLWESGCPIFPDFIALHIAQLNIDGWRIGMGHLVPEIHLDHLCLNTRVILCKHRETVRG